MSDFSAPRFIIGFDGEEAAVTWGDRDMVPVKIASKVRMRDATAAEARRYGVMKRLVGSRWYKSSHTACAYPKIKPYRLADTLAANKAANLRELAAPSTYRLIGDGNNTRDLLAGGNRPRTQDALQIALIEARYADWQAAQMAACEPEYRMAA